MTHGRIVLTLAGALALGALAGAARADSGAAAAFAEQAPTPADQCDVLIALCHAAQVALDRSERTPWGNRTDVLITRQSGTARLAVEDALAAAEVIERRNGGRLPCFDDPECVGILPRKKK